MSCERVEICRRNFIYWPITGVVVSRKTLKVIGYDNHSYIRLTAENLQIYAHQVAFALMVGRIPDEIDHKDLNRSNNAWSNLRESLHHENSSNCKIRYNNKIKIKGVSWSKSNLCWRMDIQHKNIKYHSYHETIEEARQAYIIKSVELHGDFSNVG